MGILQDCSVLFYRIQTARISAFEVQVKRASTSYRTLLHNPILWASRMSSTDEDCEQQQAEVFVH